MNKLSRLYFRYESEIVFENQNDYILDNYCVT